VWLLAGGGHWRLVGQRVSGRAGDGGCECAWRRSKLAARQRERGCERMTLEWRRASVADGGGVCEPKKIGTGGSKQSGELIYYGVAS
jgi:hypothetical protein